MNHYFVLLGLIAQGESANDVRQETIDKAAAANIVLRNAWVVEIPGFTAAFTDGVEYAKDALAEPGINVTREQQS